MARNLLRLVTGASALVLWMAGGAQAQDVSRWDGDARSAARLIAGSQPAADGALRAGVEVKLKSGWHTYWRYPGDAGVPPRFDFSGSQNVRRALVLWPAPQRIVEAGGTAIGYLTGVIFPLRVEALDSARPLLLRLRLDYAICEKLCVPAEAKAELALTRGAASRDAALMSAEARVPRKVALGEGDTLAIRSVRRELAAVRPRVVIDVAGRGVVDLFAEGPTAQWALPLPAKVAGAPAGAQRFAFDLDGLPPGASDRNALITFTASAPDDAIEVTARLD